MGKMHMDCKAFKLTHRKNSADLLSVQIANDLHIIVTILNSCVATLILVLSHSSDEADVNLY